MKKKLSNPLSLSLPSPLSPTPQNMEFLDWKSIGSILATFMFLRTAIHDFLPPEIYEPLKQFFLRLFAAFQSNVSILIEEFDSSYNNEIFESVQSYLSSKCFSSAKILKLSKPKNSKKLVFTMDSTQKIDDTFNGIPVSWSLHRIQKNPHTYSIFGSGSQERRFFQLSFHKKYKSQVHSVYLPHVMEEAANIKFKNRELKLYTNRSVDDHGRFWSSVPFSHPSTFDTVAIDPVLKEEIKSDLLNFVNRQKYYSRVGRAWKRGYLLYGPPGTGKTSLIAAIANFLEFDIYDLELTAVMSNSELRKLLIGTSSKSVIVVEDVDCTLDLSDRNKQFVKKERECGDFMMETEEKMGEKERNDGGVKFSMVSLSGVLNFVDGLWSSCGGERLIIFTTNHKEKLDQALLRAGRMDKHIHLSYCEFDAFKTLARNYLDTDDHKLFGEIEEVLVAAKMTPADVAEIFMSCNDDADVGMRNVLEEMKRRLNAEECKKEMEGMEKEVEDKEEMGKEMEAEELGKKHKE
ncbi:AAA-ATPase At3g50940-like [Magnolia sinica]|uniref:AAA-ATPase At3g50940-like n=1 Tax=Magnolia sinica TaxID=86752 RepID=UPI002657C3E7|nr:AAA-ATPase At3g50940-like [Magnolia sinica]